MLLKTFQTTVLETVSAFARMVASESENQSKLATILTAQGIKVPTDAVGKAAWEELRKLNKLPSGSLAWVERRDPLGREIYSGCLKVPTGGGKTLLGAHAVGRLLESLYLRKTGLVVWLVPSEAIFAQTQRAFTSPGHPYRGALESAANGKLKILDKRSQISQSDVDSNLCVLLVMLQATVRERSDVLKIFRDSGAFHGFFPSVEDQAANAALKAQVSNLDVLDAAEQGIPGTSIRQSLANVLRCVRPLFVVDEGHRAYTDLARDALQDLNPSFILELSATPNIGVHKSNILTSVSGVVLKESELIKLPINIEALIGSSWQRAIKKAMATRADLEKIANVDAKDTGRKIRPIALIRAEATGARKAGAAKSADKVHVDDVKKFLVTKLQVPDAWIRLKTADVNELGDDDLLDDSCEVRVILTKDALREGWDCPFAYVLAVLNARTSKLAITQMAGRVLRQPYARQAADSKLNEAYVVCLTDDVRLAVDAVRGSLQQEGMADAGSWVKAQGAIAAPRATVARSKLLRDDFLLPLVAIRSGSSWVGFHPERHLVSRLNWKSLPLPDLSGFSPTKSHEFISTSVGLRSVNGNLTFDQSLPMQRSSLSASDAYAPAVEVLRTVIPNSWIAFDLIRAAEEHRASHGASAQQLVEERIQLAQYLAAKLATVIDKLLEQEFQDLCRSGTIKLLASARSGFGSLIPKTLDIILAPGDDPLMRANGQPLARNVFEETYRSEVNPLEQAALRAIDDSPDAKWWWRVPVKGDWGLIGWRRESIYPDFIVRGLVGGLDTLVAIETKGAQLAGNDDTKYKKTVLRALQSAYLSEAGTPTAKGLPALPEVAQHFRGLMLEEAIWQTDLAAVLPPAQAATTSKSPGRGSGGIAQRRLGPVRRTS